MSEEAVLIDQQIRVGRAAYKRFLRLMRRYPEATYLVNKNSLFSIYVTVTASPTIMACIERDIDLGLDY